MTKNEEANPQDMPVTRTIEVSGPDLKLARALELSFVPANTPALIPRRLFEHTEERSFDAKTIDRIYRLGPEMVGTPVCMLYLLLDRTHEIHGFLWTQLDPFVSELSVYAFSVDPEYQDGRWIERTAEWLFSQPFQWETLQPKILWMTELNRNQRMVITKEACISQKGQRIT